MRERNWQADWERCEKATPGPWLYHVPGVDGEWAGYVYRRGTHERVAYDVPVDDGVFIAEARVALPYWLQRVKELETENARLRAAFISAGAEITVALNGLQYPLDPEWTRRHAKAAQGVINEALAALEEAGEGS